MHWSEKLRVFACLCVLMTLSACGDDSGTSANNDKDTELAEVSNSSKALSSSSAKSVSSSSKRSEGDPSSNSRMDSVCSSSLQNDKQKNSSSSSAKVSSSVILSSSEGSSASSSSRMDSIGSSSLQNDKPKSSSSEYVPFDHSNTLAGDWRIGENRYKTFVDPRNGRSYYYITITSDYLGKSVTVMAENLNIGEMVLGADNQNDDTKIERYCYNNDTTKCDEFGGLYQWAEMMQLPSRCNTESCADLIQENHRGICPEGWRLFTWDDYVVVSDYKDDFNDGVKGLRSTYRFLGTNQSGFSLTGAGLRIENGTFSGLEEKIAFFRPEEYEADASVRAHHGIIDIYGFSPSKQHRELKVKGFSVRCTKLE